MWEHEQTQHALYNSLGLGSPTLLQLAFLGGKASDPDFPWEKFPVGQSVQNTQKTGSKGTVVTPGEDVRQGKPPEKYGKTHHLSNLPFS